MRRVSAIYTQTNDDSEGDLTQATSESAVERTNQSAARAEIRMRLLNAMSSQSEDVVKLAGSKESLRATAFRVLAYLAIPLSSTAADALVTSLVDDIVGLGPIEPLLSDDAISDIFVNGSGDVKVERNGRIIQSNIKFRDESHLLATCQRLVGAVGRRVDESAPICDARMPDGSRINVIVPPLAVDGTCLTIRKFKKEKLNLNDLVAYGSMPSKIAEFIKVAARSRLNVLVSGGTGAGKTTLLNCLAEYISPNERIVTTEDVAELQLNQSHVIRLETRPPNIENLGEITMRQLIKNCLRMRPDRIIVGEVRGNEAFDLLQAMNTGHDGSMGTIHANSCREALGRLASLVLASGVSIPIQSVREMIALAVDIIIQVERLPNGERKVTQVAEVVGMEDSNILTQDFAVYNKVDANWETQGSLSARTLDKMRHNGDTDSFANFM